MFKNYLIIAWRNLWKNKAFSAINIFGLAVGIACALLIIFHVKDELSYDRGFTKADRVFRITRQISGENAREWAATAPPLGNAMKDFFPEVEQFVRFHRYYPYIVFSYAGTTGAVNRFEERGGFFADPAVIDVFDIPFSKGNPATALSNAGSIIISEELAKKYFGSEDPIGKTMMDEGKKNPFTVTGVFKPFAFNAHLHFDYLLPMESLYDKYQDRRSMENHNWSGFYSYIVLKNAKAKAAVESKMPDFLARFYASPGRSREQILSSGSLLLQPVTDIHLHSKLEKEMYANSDITYVYIFSIAALFILLIAAVNFINIATAQAFSRMKEIGLRKVVGASKPQLVKQFLGESLLITLLATVLALLLFKTGLPFYEKIASKELHFEKLLTVSNAGILLLLVLLIGVLAGFYPAWFVANFNPVNSIKGKKITGSSVNVVRKGLIVFQFVVSVFMIFSTIVIYRQMQYFHNKDLGFDKEQIVAVTMYNDMWPRYTSLTNNLKKNPAIESYAIVSHLPGERVSSYDFELPNRKGTDDLPGIRAMWANENLFSTMNMTLKEGRNFISQFPDIKRGEFIMNEAGVKAYKLEHPLGEKVFVNGDSGEIVGVVKDFNYASLHGQVEPLIISYNPYNANYLLVKAKPNRLTETLKYIESNVKTLVPSSPFNYTFVDEKLARLYESENRLSTVFKAFAVFAIFISCLGLFGLSAYSARLRTKEVGIRKVLGASLSSITLLLSKDFMKLVLIAIIISLPLAWWVMNEWLQGFAYHADIDLWIFMMSGIFAALVALFTVSFQAIKTALLNPAESVKVE